MRGDLPPEREQEYEAKEIEPVAPVASPGIGTGHQRHRIDQMCIRDSFSTPLFKNVKDAIAHRYAPPSFFGLTVRHEDHAGFPIQVLDAHPVKLSRSACPYRASR